MGVGGNDSWSDVAAPLDKYQIKAQPYQYSFYLVPLNARDKVLSEEAKKIKILMKEYSNKIKKSFKNAFSIAPAFRLGAMKIILCWALAQMYFFTAEAQKEVPQQTMQQIYEQVKTPFKYGLVVVPPDVSKKIDCPSVFRKGKHWYMTYILFDGRGYETWLAKSNNLLQWKTLGRILRFSDTTNKEQMDWDANQKAGYIALQDEKFGGSYKLKKYNGKYWLSYIGGKETGYEAGS